LEKQFIKCRNDGPKLLESNFWDLPDEGKFIVSINAAAFRILLPRRMEHYVADMATAREVAISRGPWPARRREDAFEFLFDDDSDWPTVLLAAKAYGSVFYDKLTPSIVRTKW
jgi:hypothetical protein